MNTIGYWQNLFAAFTGKAPQPKSEQHPFYFSFTNGSKRPTPKQTMNYAKLRSFSESPIPRRAVNYIKTQITSLPWDVVVKGDKKPNRNQRKNIDIAKNVLTMPNDDDTWKSFIDQVVEDMLVVGAGVIEKRLWVANPDRPLVLYPVDGASIQIYIEHDGSAKTPKYAQVDAVGRFKNFTPEQLAYIRMNPRTNSPFGLSPMEIASSAIEYFLNSQAFAAKQSSLAIPRKMIDLGEEVDQQQVKEFRVYWADEIEGRGKTAIVGGTKGSKSIDLGAKGDSELFLEWQRFLIRVIAQAFDIDVQKFGEVGGVNRSTGDILDDSTMETAIIPLASVLEAHINREIISVLGFDDLEFKFRFTASHKDRKAVASIIQILTQSDLITVDEARAELGYEPLPEGKGKYTLAEYRAIYGGANTVNAPGEGVVQDTGHNMEMESNPKQTEGQAQTPALKDDPVNKGPDK